MIIIITITIVIVIVLILLIVSNCSSIRNESFTYKCEDVNLKGEPGDNDNYNNNGLILSKISLNDGSSSFTVDDHRQYYFAINSIRNKNTSLEYIKYMTFWVDNPPSSDINFDIAFFYQDSNAIVDSTDLTAQRPMFKIEGVDGSVDNIISDTFKSNVRGFYSFSIPTGILTSNVLESITREVDSNDSVSQYVIFLGLKLKGSIPTGGISFYASSANDTRIDFADVGGEYLKRVNSVSMMSITGYGDNDSIKQEQDQLYGGDINNTEDPNLRMRLETLESIPLIWFF